jgi:MraZ protein
VVVCYGVKTRIAAANGAKWKVEPVEPLFLGGEYDITVDDKNRFSMPSELRRMIDPEAYGDGLIALVGVNKKPWLYPDKYYRKLLSRLTPRAVPPEDLLKFDHFNVSMTFPVPMDKQGRVVLPDKIVRRTGVKGEVTLAGARDHVELWPRAAWEEYYESLQKSPSEVALKARMAIAEGDQII